jgi:diacylglycerol kinase (ATP)
MADSQDSWVPRSPGRVVRAFVWSMQGLSAGFRTESSVRLEMYLLLVFGPLALWLGHDGVERALLFGSLLPVLGAELLNSALEVIVDRLWPGHDERAGRAKDMGSAAVFVFMVNMLCCWVLVLWPHFF